MQIVHLPIFLVFARAAQATLFTSPDQITKSAYDFVVVGAGTAGSVIASRLSENPAVSVLVIEAGGNDAGLVETQIPFTAANLLNDTSILWNYQTVPQPSLKNRVLPFQRGRLLGGSSSVNYMAYTRGSRDDFDRYASVTGDTGWSWDSMLPFMLKAEGFVDPVDHHNTTEQFDPSVHGYSGPLLTTLTGIPSDLDGRMIATTQADPALFPFNLDANSGDMIGMGWAQSTAGNGERSSSATAYLHPAMDRPNLDVLIQTQVTRITSNSPSDNTAASSSNFQPDMRTVEFAQNSTSPRQTIIANKEVILSAGAVNTPQVLQLSGIGDDSFLSSIGINSIVKSPGVGKNLQDHPLVGSQFYVNSNNTLDSIARNATFANQLLTQWQLTRTGQFATPPENHITWLRVPSNIFNGVSDPSAGPTSPHIEIVILNLFASSMQSLPETGSFISVINGVASPTSRGNVTVKTSNPFDYPAIDPGYMTNPVDLSVMIQALRTSDALLATAPWNGFVIKPFGARENATTDAQLAEYVYDNVVTFWHASGTAKMGTRGDQMAVVDASLRVKGAKGMRVVDASVFPFIPAAHPQAAVYAIAERAANLIQSTWGI